MIPAGSKEDLLGRGQRLQEQTKWGEAEALFRRGLAQAPESIALRLKVAETLIQQARPCAVQRILAPALKRLEGSLSSALRLQRFKLLAMLRRYPELFEEGRRILARDRSPETLRVLHWPWGLVWSDQGSAHRYFAEDISRLSRTGRDASCRLWSAFYRHILARRIGRTPADGLASWETGPKEYGWMGFEVGRAKLYRGDFPGALRAFRAYLDVSHPKDWQAYAYCGEIYACLRRPAKSVAQFGAACRCAPPHEVGGALAWLGQVLLWLGRREKAKAVLDRACALGARYSFCWRAAAWIALGRSHESLPDLDRALELKPWDLEAWVWRGEAKRHLGDLDGSLRDLDRACGLFPEQSLWAYANRALTHAALGRPMLMRRDYRAIESRAEIVYARNRSGINPSTSRRIQALLEALLRLNQGYRDNLTYKSAVWMKQ